MMYKSLQKVCLCALILIGVCSSLHSVSFNDLKKDLVSAVGKWDLSGAIELISDIRAFEQKTHSDIERFKKSVRCGDDNQNVIRMRDDLDGQIREIKEMRCNFIRKWGNSTRSEQELKQYFNFAKEVCDQFTINFLQGLLYPEPNEDHVPSRSLHTKSCPALITVSTND